MINTIGLLLNPHTDFELNPAICVEDIIREWNFLRKQEEYFPCLKLLPDKKLKIEFSPAKLLYGHNLYEITFTNIQQVLSKLSLLLRQAHIHTCPEILLCALVYHIDFAKVCYILFGSYMLLPYLQEMHQGGHYKQAVTFYHNDGHMIASSLKHRKICFYNKSAEILQDKRVASDLKDIINDLPGTFYRFECSFKTSQEIRRGLNACGISIDRCCLQELSQTNVIQTVLKKNLNDIFQHWHVQERTKAIDKIRTWMNKYKYSHVRPLLTDMLYAAACTWIGTENVRQTIEKHLDKRCARDFMKRFDTLQLEDINYVSAFKEKFINEIETLNPINKTYLDSLERKKIVKGDDFRRFAPVLLALIELLISTPLG